MVFKESSAISPHGGGRIKDLFAGISIFGLFWTVAWTQPSWQNRGVYPLPQALIINTFTPDRVQNTPSGLVFLDLDSKRLAKETGGTIQFSAGFGEEEDGLFDPVDLETYNLSLFVCDQSQNRLVQFDQRLNYVGEFITRNEKNGQFLYPKQVAVDSRGYFFIYSSEFHSVWRGNRQEPGFDRFIDLDQEAESINCVQELAVNERNELALLFPCRSQFRIYSPVGRKLRSVRVEIREPAFLIPVRDQWVILNHKGETQVWSNGESELFQLKAGPGNILDVVADENILMVLFEDRVLQVEYEGD
jgi:hypothetical protein